MTHVSVGKLCPLGQTPVVAFPGSQLATVELFPLVRVETRVGKLAQAQHATGTAEIKVAG